MSIAKGPSGAAAMSLAALAREGLLPRFALLMLGVWLNAADALVTVTVMPSVARDVGGYAYLGWASAAFLLGAITAGASGGALAGRLGLRAAMGLGALVYALGCAADALAPGVAAFLAGRLVQGVGAGWIIALAFVAVGAVFPERFWARVFSAITAVWGVATVLGPLIGGLFASAGVGAWRGAFWFFAVQGLVFLPAALALLPPTRGEARPGAPFGPLALIAAGVLAIGVAGLLSGPLAAAGLILLGLGLLVLALRLDARARRPMLPRAALDLGSPAGAGYAAIFLLQAAVIAWSVYGPLLLQAVDGVSPLVSGYVVGGESVGWTLAALAVGGLGRAWPDRLIRLGPGLVVLGLILLGPSLAMGGPLASAAASVLIGAGFGLTWSFLNRKILASLSDGERALGSSAIPTVQMIGNAAGAAAASALGDLIGLGRAVSAAEGRALAPTLFAAFVPLALLGWTAANRTVALAPSPRTAPRGGAFAGPGGEGAALGPDEAGGGGTLRRRIKP
jgi:MFS family permease